MDSGRVDSGKGRKRKEMSVEWIGVLVVAGHKPYKVTFSSDNFQQLYDWAVKLIKK